jgi:hypothetical protein
MPILFCNIAWMKYYRGLRGDIPTGGGSYIAEHGTGSEIHNFNDKDNVIKGFVMIKEGGSINIQRLGAKDDAEELNDVTVVWVAPSPLGNVIVGWYLQSTVLKNMKKDSRFNDRAYNIIAKPQNSFLLPINKRTFQIPRGAGGMGQSNIWYAEKQPKEFIENVLAYIKSDGELIVKKNRIGRTKSYGRNSDPLKRQRVEEKAILVISKYFTSLGYEVQSFEKDNLGWDLQAHLGDKQFLRLEVKGLSGDSILIELTPNEFANMEKYSSSYRICVVTNTLQKPNIYIFSYSPDHRNWEDDKGNVLRIQKIVSARMDIA